LKSSYIDANSPTDCEEASMILIISFYISFLISSIGERAGTTVSAAGIMTIGGITVVVGLTTVGV